MAHHTVARCFIPMIQPASQRAGTALPHFQYQNQGSKTRLLLHVLLPCVLAGACSIAWRLDVVPHAVTHYPVWALVAGLLLTSWASVRVGCLVWHQFAHQADDRNAVVHRRIFGRSKWR